MRWLWFFVLGIDVLTAGDEALVPRAARPSEPVAGPAHEGQVLVVLITVGLEGREFRVIYKKLVHTYPAVSHEVKCGGDVFF